ncbi:glycosyltransferase [Desertibaculum subflavum]|uniref:glycosyltransferase n=1 Tax=Desertibaculum subflavum TaxID=2268458 RepID=UPI000E66B2B0
MSRPLAFVLKGYPRLSETFIAQEIAALEARGLDIVIISLRHPTDRHRHPVHDEIKAQVVYLPEYLYQEPLRVLRAWRKVRRWPSYAAVRRLWLRDLRRDRTTNRGRRFGQALVLAAELEGRIRGLHAHFIHTPGSVARYAAQLMGLDFSISAHAKDIYTIPDWEKAEKLADARFAVTCTSVGAAHLAGLAPAGRVSLCYHGLDLTRFPPPPARSVRDGRDPADPVRIVSVGRAVAKKGYDDLLDALARLPRELNWRFIHVGGGVLSKQLKSRAAELGLAGRIEWRGAQPQSGVIAALREGDLFVLAAKVAADGDRDGLPNVLMEAASQRLCSLSTNTGAIGELIRDGETGMLVPPGDPARLAQAVALLAADPGLRDRLGRAAEARLKAEFGMAAGIDHLSALFGLEAGERRACA